MNIWIDTIRDLVSQRGFWATLAVLACFPIMIYFILPSNTEIEEEENED